MNQAQHGPIPVLLQLVYSYPEIDSFGRRHSSDGLHSARIAMLFSPPNDLESLGEAFKRALAPHGSCIPDASPPPGWFIAEFGGRFTHVLQVKMKPPSSALAEHPLGFTTGRIEELSRDAAQSCREATRPACMANAADASPEYDPLGGYPVMEALDLSFEKLRALYARHEAELIASHILKPLDAAPARRLAL